MDLGLTDRRVVVTGASRGIGYAIARSFVAEGAVCVVSARNPEMLAAAADELNALGHDHGRAIPIAAEMGIPGEAERLIGSAARAMGGVDILVNNAASVAAKVSDPSSVDREVLLHQFEVKALGYLECAQAAVVHMAADGWGRIVNIAGIASRHAGDMGSGMRNAAIINMTKNLSAVLGPRGITVNAISPGQIATEAMFERMRHEAASKGITYEEVERKAAATTAIRRMVMPDDIAIAAVWIASEPMGAFTGQVVAVDGGLGEWIYY